MSSQSCVAGVSLNAATVTGAGDTVYFDEPKSTVSMQVHVTGSPTFFVALEGSVDGVNFHQFSGVGVNDGIYSLPDVALVAARANLTSLTGGTAPTVSASIAAA